MYLVISVIFQIHYSGRLCVCSPHHWIVSLFKARIGLINFQFPLYYYTAPMTVFLLFLHIGFLYKIAHL